jgi:ubiquinone/menaquinone biosynthesis C-methylase UbiE
MSAQPQWQFVGNVPENYERYLVPSIFGPWAKDLVEIARLQPGERVLDIACGTGIVARTAGLILASSGSIIGLDVSLPMLAVAQSAAAAEGLSIEWQEGTAVELPLIDAACDVVLCQQGLQFFPDRPAALREMHRVLRSHGRLVLSVWTDIDRCPGFAVLAEALTHRISAEAGALMTSGPFALGRSEELRTLVANANFRDVDIRTATKMLEYPSPQDFVLRYVAGSALGGFFATANESAQSALLEDISLALSKYVDNQGLAFPIESNLLIARK